MSEESGRVINDVSRSRGIDRLTFSGKERICVVYGVILPKADLCELTQSNQFINTVHAHISIYLCCLRSIIPQS